MNNFDPFNVRRKHHSIFSSPSNGKRSQQTPDASFHELDDISETSIDPRTSHEASSPTAAGGMSSYAIPRGATPLSSDYSREHHKPTATEKINSMFTAKGELPMYKDKPYNYSGSRRLPFYRRKRILLVIPLLLAFFLIPGLLNRSSAKSRVKSAIWQSGTKAVSIDWSGRQERVKEAFRVNWRAYETYAWGE